MKNNHRFLVTFDSDFDSLSTIQRIESKATAAMLNP